jgi:RNA recognition motif-containing protein
MTESWRAKIEQLKEQKRREAETKQAAEAAAATPSPEAVAPAGAAPAPSPGVPAHEFRPPSDDHSIFVGSVDFSVTKEELTEFFQPCGLITRCTIRTDHFTHKPKGHAYVEFAELDGVENVLKLDSALFRGRNLQIRRKRGQKPKPPRRRFRRQ